jgi:hypothetical protein
MMSPFKFPIFRSLHRFGIRTALLFVDVVVLRSCALDLKIASAALLRKILARPQQFRRWCSSLSKPQWHLHHSPLRHAPDPQPHRPLGSTARRIETEAIT